MSKFIKRTPTAQISEPGAEYLAADDFAPQPALATGAAVAAIVDGAHGMDSAANFLTLYNKVVKMETALLAYGILKP